jgi:hypothetical protein
VHFNLEFRDRLRDRIMGQSSRRLDLTAELSRRGLQRADFSENAYWFEVETPAHRFTNVVAVLDRQHYLGLVARDSFDPQLAASVVQFVRDRQAEIVPTKPVEILERFHHQGCLFDCVLVVSPQANVLYQADSPALHSRSFEAIPIYRCEFSGDETPELFKLVRSDFVPTLDWRRSPAPRIWMSFRDAASGVRSTGHKSSLATLDEALYQIHQLPLAEDSWVQIDNYSAERARLSFQSREYVIESGAGDTRAVPESEIDGWTKQFLTLGLHPETRGVNPSTSEPKPPTPRLSLYLADYQRDRYIDAKEPVAVDLGKALDEFDRLSDTRGCFIGFRRNDGEVLQFIWNHDQTLSADIPVSGRRASLVRRGTWDELRPLIERFANGAPTRELPDFHLESHDQSNRPFSNGSSR